MDGLCVRFYVREGMRFQGQGIADWLFARARQAGIQGGTLFRAAAGFGRHGLHEDHFFELAGTLPAAVEFFAPTSAVEALMQQVDQAGLELPYISWPVKLGVTGQAR